MVFRRRKDSFVLEVTPVMLRNRHLCRMAFLFVIYSILLISVCGMGWDSDTWFLAATGRYIIENGAIPRVNPFTIHENLYMIVQQWAMCLVNYFVVSNGPMGRVLYMIFIYTLALVVTYIYFYGFVRENTTISQNAKTERTAILVLIAGLHLITIATTRPSIVSYCNILLFLSAVRAYDRTGNKLYLIAGPLAALVEINMHASFWPILFVMLLPYIFIDFIPKKAEVKAQFTDWFIRKKSLFAMSVTMFIAGFANPIGTDAMKYMFLSYGHTQNISETAAPKTTSFQGVLIVIAIVCSTVWFYATFKKSEQKTLLETVNEVLKNHASELYMSAGTLVMAYMHYRNSWFLLVGVYPIVLRMFVDGFQEIKWQSRNTGGVYLVRAGVLVVVGMMLIFTQYSSVSTNPLSDTFYSPVSAADWLDEHVDKENIVLYTSFNNGAFMQWRGYKTYIDARPEIYQKDINGVFDYYDEYRALMNPSADFEAFVEKYEFTHLLIEKRSALWTYMAHNDDFEFVVDKEDYSVFARRKGVE